jgi:TatD DNase family protein
MPIDAHCHPFDLFRKFPDAEKERKRLDIIALASACNIEEFLHNEDLAKKAAEEKASPVLLCFAVHPQAVKVNEERQAGMEILDKLAGEGRLAAVGECGFDLYNIAFKETEAQQDRILTAHLETALYYDLPVILHIRRAMHKIFAASKTLSKCRAVIFHSWAGTAEEGDALLRRGINAYFSFGNTVINGHKKAMKSCVHFPKERLLTETDAPYQPQRGKDFSQWADLQDITKAIAALRGESSKDIEAQIKINFFDVFH